MTREVRTCASEDQLVDIMEVTTLQRIRHLPVVENGVLQGIVSIGDVVKQRLEEVQSEAEDLRRYIRSPYVRATRTEAVPFNSMLIRWTFF